MEIIENEQSFGQVEIDDDFWEDLTTEVEAEKKETETEEESKESEESEKTETEEEETSEEEESEEEEQKEEQDEITSEESEDAYSDEKIFEKFGEDVDPGLVRHYEIVKDYLVLDEDFKFDGKNLQEAYELDSINRSKALADQLLERLPESYKILIGQGIQNSHANITPEGMEYLLQVGKTKLQNTYDEENEDSVKEYVRGALIEQGTDPSDVNDIIEMYSDKNKLEQVAAQYKQAKDAHLANLEQVRLDEEAEIKRVKKQQQKEFVDRIDKVITDNNYQKGRANLIKTFIYDSGKTGDTPLVETLKHIYSNPEALVTLADMASYYDIKTGKWDMSKFEKKAVTKATKKFKSNIEEKLSGSNAFKSISSSKSKAKVDFDWDDVDI